MPRRRGNAAAMGRPGSRRSFTCFGRLPTELRLMIWEESLPIWNVMIYCGIWYKPKTTLSEGWPAHLLTCREAREVALKRRPWECPQINIFWLHVDRYDPRAMYTTMAQNFGARVGTFIFSDGRKRHGKCLITDLRRVIVLESTLIALRGFFGRIIYESRVPYSSQVQANILKSEKVLFVMATVKCKGLDWLFESSNLIVLSFNDSRLKRVLEQLEPQKYGHVWAGRLRKRKRDEVSRCQVPQPLHLPAIAMQTPNANSWIVHETDGQDGEIFPGCLFPEWLLEKKS
ncbi:hypothetical protein F5Y08DRAFT_350188 [Xylaria arbuscula]|nr:hypothetical protein F5Y08DRAFT_350188 [Xylaria arbuscula]